MPELSPEDALEVEADLRQRVTSAFRLGSEASPRSSGPSAVGQLAAGLALTLAIVLVVGVIALAQGSSTSGGAGRTPAPTATPTR